LKFVTIFRFSASFSKDLKTKLLVLYLNTIGWSLDINPEKYSQ